NLGTMGPGRSGIELGAKGKDLMPMMMQNKSDMAYYNSATAEKAMMISFKAEEQMLALMARMDPNLAKIANGIMTAEGALFDLVNKGIDGMEEMIEVGRELIDKIQNFKMPSLSDVF
ncbi:MAG: hypothetical protein KDK37_17660, partial [Leptospiraceae bacterium]|nr:hypothetical protein [Leptospiraceae bacterium]